MDVAYEGRVKETRKQPERSKTANVGRKIEGPVAWIEENVHFVEKASNPQNIHQARSFGSCSILEKKVYKLEWQVRTYPQLISRIQS